ncbi:hypothetical protein [Thermococcus gorgonarius]
MSEELGFPLSTVSYHIDRMLRVGLVEAAGEEVWEETSGGKALPGFQ